MGAIPYKKCAMSTDPWDGGAQEKKLEANKANCRGMYAWVDPEGDANTKAAYKLPFHIVGDSGAPGAGSVKACQAIIGILNGARGGADVPDADREAVYNMISKHLKDAGETPAPLRSAEEMVATRAIDGEAADQVENDAVEGRESQEDEVNGDEADTDNADDDSESQTDSAECDTEGDDAGSERSSDESSVRHGQMEGRNVRRLRHAEVRAINVDGAPGVALKIIKYNCVDDYGSVWQSGSVIDGLNDRLPQLVFNHDRSTIIGRAVPGFIDDGDGQIVNFRFANFQRVPKADEVHSLVEDGIIDECSVGFRWEYEFHTPSTEELQRWPGATEIITRAFVSEVSIVMEGAVPGAKVLSVRATRGGQWIDREQAAKLVVQFAQGNIPLIDALQGLQDASVDMPMQPMDQQDQLPPDDTETDGTGCEDEDEGSEGESDVNIEVNVTIGDDGDESDDGDDVELDQELLDTLHKILGVTS